MTDIRIRDLPTASPPVATDFVPIDNGSTRKTDIQTLVETGRPAASQAEAEAGTNPTKVMTPLTTAQAVSSYGLTKSGNLAGLADKPTARSNLDLGNSSTLSVGTTAGTVAAGDDSRIVGAIQPSTLPTTAFAVYADALSRTITDRSKDYIVVNDLSDGSGDPSNDDVAFQDALDIVASSDANQKVMLITRPYQLLTEKNLPVNCHIRNAHGDGRIFGNANMRSILNIDKDALAGAGAGVVLQDLSMGNRDNNFAYAQSLIRVNKDWDDSKVILRDMSFFSANKAIDWVDGDCPLFFNIRSTNCVDTLYFRNNGMNGYVFGLSTLGGRGLYITKNNSAAEPQQMEGTKFYGVQILPSGPVNGQTLNGMEIFAGLRLEFHGLLLDQVSGSVGMLIDASTHTVSSIGIFGLWIGGAENMAGGSFGAFVKGGVTALSISEGEIVVIPGVGIQFDGQSSSFQAKISKVRFRQNDSLGIFANAGRLTVNGCEFMDADSLATSSSVFVTGAQNHFESGTPSFGGPFNMLTSTGVAANFAHVPSSSAGLPRGWLYLNSGVLSIT